MRKKKMIKISLLVFFGILLSCFVFGNSIKRGYCDLFRNQNIRLQEEFNCIITSKEYSRKIYYYYLDGCNKYRYIVQLEDVPNKGYRYLNETFIISDKTMIKKQAYNNIILFINDRDTLRMEYQIDSLDGTLYNAKRIR